MVLVFLRGISLPEQEVFGQNPGGGGGGGVCTVGNNKQHARHSE